jgi:hypothetical protein
MSKRVKTEKEKAQARIYSRKWYAKKQEEKREAEAAALDRTSPGPKMKHVVQIEPERRGAATVRADKRAARKQKAVREEEAIRKAAAKLASDVERDYGPGNQRVYPLDLGQRIIPPSMAEVMTALQKISYAVQESGAMVAVFTWPDGSSATFDSLGAILCKPPVLS